MTPPPILPQHPKLLLGLDGNSISQVPPFYLRGSSPPFHLPLMPPLQLRRRCHPPSSTPPLPPQRSSSLIPWSLRSLILIHPNRHICSHILSSFPFLLFPLNTILPPWTTRTHLSPCPSPLPLCNYFSSQNFCPRRATTILSTISSLPTTVSLLPKSPPPSTPAPLLFLTPLPTTSIQSTLESSYHPSFASPLTAYSLMASPPFPSPPQSHESEEISPWLPLHPLEVLFHSLFTTHSLRSFGS